MAKPIYLHSGMVGAPQIADANRSAGDILSACLVNGFNTQAVSSASALGGVLTLNYASDPGFEVASTMDVSGASVAEANGKWRVLSAAANQVTLDAPGVPDGAVGGTIITKYAAAGWTEPFVANTQTRVFRMAGGSLRYFRVYQAVGNYPLVRGYEAMTGISTGTGPFPTTTQHSGNGLVLIYPSPPVSTWQWWVLATESGVYYQVTDGALAAGWAYLGDPTQMVKAADAFATICGGYGFAASYAYIARSHTGTGGSQDATKHELYTGTLTTPSPIANSQRFLYGVPVSAASVARGMLPNAFGVIPSAPNTDATVTLTDVSGIDGRVRYLAGASEVGRIALALDEDWV